MHRSTVLTVFDVGFYPTHFEDQIDSDSVFILQHFHLIIQFVNGLQMVI